MINSTLAVLVAAVSLQSPLIPDLEDWRGKTGAPRLEGQATYYNNGVMAKVATNRKLITSPGIYADWLADNGLVGGVALNRAGDMWRRVWLRGPLGIEGPFLSMDCAQLKHFAGRERAGRVVEVDYTTAERWGMVGVGPVGVVVYFQDPTKKAPHHAPR